MAAQSSKKTNKVSAYFRGVRSELRKVIWPSRKELINYTGVVILISAIISLIVYFLDLGLHQILKIFM